MSRTNCLDFERRLNEVLDRHESPHDDDVLTAHADECSECNRYLSVQQSVMQIIGTAGFENGLESNVTRSSLRYQTSPGWSVVSALAICLAIGLALPRMANRSAEQFSDESPMLVAQIHASSDKVPEPVTQSPRVQTESNLTMLVTVDGAVESWQQFLASSTANAEWLEPVATPIRPLADSMTSTFNVLRKTMPGVRRMQDEERRESLDSAQRFHALGHVV